ncbi:phospholipase A1-like [Tribolium castaneum]|uniref:phospholipase A1-like n=1 Tax=Tribolium castaneum TaxID=7070 RepID=UPI00077DB61C|nr:PREDICTED: phospholipase A1-like [Tribolium castaneum]|eukprot:XP_008197948.2 PREDICTED: phospholipase A1-like [Tribolium castaneum]
MSPLVFLFLISVTTIREIFSQNLINEDSSFLSQLFNVSINNIAAVANGFSFINIPTDNVKFLLFERTSNQTITLNHDDPLEHLVPSDPTILITHGWTDQGTASWIQDMAFLYHKKGNYNVIAVDWSIDADRNYIYSSSATQSVGIIIGAFLIQVSKKVDNFFEKVHLIGHSLGAQVVGFAGKYVENSTDSKLDRITGLDAASPLFETPILRPPELRLADTDASFVDLIHTALGVGYIGAFGTADFYVNGGIIQLNCTDDLTDIASCNHQSSHIYYSETILERKKYEATKCEDAVRFNLGLCDDNDNAYMGDEVSRSAKGVYFINVDREGNEETK